MLTTLAAAPLAAVLSFALSAALLAAASLLALASAGLPADIGSCCEIYREPLFVDRGLAPRHSLPHTRAWGETSLAFLVHHTIDEISMRRYASDVARALQTLAAPDAAEAPSLR